MTRKSKSLLDYSTALWITSARLGINSRKRVVAPNRAAPPVWAEKGDNPGAGVMYDLKSVDERNDDKVPT